MILNNEPGDSAQDAADPAITGDGRPDHRLAGTVIWAGILLVTLCFLWLAEWAIGNAARNEAYEAAVRIAEAATRLQNATDQKRFFTSISQATFAQNEKDRFFIGLEKILGHPWRPWADHSSESVRVWRFDEDGRLMDFHGPASEAEDIEHVWNATILKTWQCNGRKMSPEELALIQRGSNAAKSRLSPFMNLEDIWHSSTFLLGGVDAEGRKFRFSFLRQTLDEMSPARSGWMGYVREDAFDPLFVERRIASVLSYENVDYCAIQYRTRLMVPASKRLSGTSWRDLRLPRSDGTILTNRFGTFAAFRLGEGHILALGCKPGRIASIPGWLRLAAGCCCIAFALVGGRGLARLLTARQASGIGLQVKIFAMFFLASWVPFTAFLGIGLSEAADSKDASLRLWRSRLFQRVDAADRRFRNQLESVQRDMSDLAVRVAGHLAAGDWSALRRILAEETHGNFAVCFGADGQIWRKEIKRQDTGGLDKAMQAFGKLVFKRIIEAARGEPDQPAKQEQTVRLDAADIVGEGHPLLHGLHGRGRVMRGNLFSRETSIFWELLRDAAGRAIGILFVNIMVDDESLRFGNTLTRHRDADGIRVKQMYNSVLYPDNRGNSPDLIRMCQDLIRRGCDGAGIVGDGGDGKNLVAVRPSSFNSNMALLSMVSYETVEQSFRRSSGAILQGLMLALLPVVVIAVFLNRRIAGPISALTKAGKMVAAGNDAPPLPIGGPAELSTLATSFNVMVEGLRQRERMRRYLSAAAWEASAGGVTAEQVEVAVLSSDIRGFTTISERHPAGEIVAMLNDYFTGMERVIRRHGGDVDRFVGDAITAVFTRTAGEDEAGHIRRAVLAGAEMRSALAGFNAARKAAGLFTIENGVGVDVGVAVRGLVGAAEGRRDITIIGNIMARSAACEAASRFGAATKIVVSPGVADRLRSGFTWNRLAVQEAGADLFELEGLP
ncbi:MAG TPA: adenylate/guanylate cyclase domain-containing protein [Candidatus Ozemobacteraceae bacterium]|nr:adenylate/guanylate cyclase domain-containing protein [Candidatus Ozemobacteraceae bacterium]